MKGPRKGLNFSKEVFHPPCTVTSQDLTKDSATLTGWRRSQQSGEGKMVPWLGPGIYTSKYRVFPVVTEFSRDLLCEKMIQ